MKISHLLLVALFTAPIMASAESQIQKLKEMGECMNKIDSNEMQALADRGKKMMAEVTTLCNAGKRDEAKTLQEQSAKQEESTPLSQSIKKCGEIAKIDGKESKNPFKDMHVCDTVKKLPPNS